MPYGINVQQIVPNSQLGNVLTATGATTLLAPAIMGGYISNTGTTANATHTTDTAVSILQQWPDQDHITVGAHWDMVYENTTAYTITLAAGTGVTASGEVTIPGYSTATFRFVIASSTTLTVDRIMVNQNTANDVITSASANAFTVGANGTTNPAFNVDASTASSATGWQAKSAAAAGGAALSVISSGTNENGTIDAKGSGTLTLNGTATGNVISARNFSVTGTTTGTSTGASALAVGANGATNPVIQVDASTGSVATGWKLTGAAAAGGAALAVISSGTNENGTVDAKGSGTLTLNGTATGNIVLGRAATGVSLAVTGALTSSSPSAGIGYATGAGGAVTQITNAATPVTLNTLSGQITTVALTTAAGAEEEFTFNNTSIGATDVVVPCTTYTGAGTPAVSIKGVAAGSCVVNITNLHAANALNAVVVINFVVLKGVIA